MSIEYLPITGVMAAVAAFILSIKQAIKVHSESKAVHQDLIKNNYISNHNLERRVANEAIFRLSSYAQKISPDFIVGINRGGTMVGAFISLGLGVPSKNFSTCQVSKNGKYKIYCDTKNMYGTVLVIDDVSRSGRTIEEAINEIKKNNSKIKNIYSAVLITTIDKENRSNYKDLNYFSFATTDKDVYLPWTPRLKNKLNIESHRIKLFKEVKGKSLDKIALEVSISLYNHNKKL